MAKFDHRFWEIAVDRATLESLLVEPDLVEQLLNAVVS